MMEPSTYHGNTSSIMMTMKEGEEEEEEEEEQLESVVDGGVSDLPLHLT